jgi:nitrite reductase/ring-hydroxylating ferredoxin subunit
MDSGWVRVAGENEVQDGAAKEVVIGSRIVAIFRHHGRLFALDGMCAHQGGPIAEGNVQDGCVTCPWHGWQYELETGVQTVNRKPLQETFPIRVRDGQIEVQVDRSAEP